MSNVSRIPVLYGFSSHVIPKPHDWPAWVYVVVLGDEVMRKKAQELDEKIRGEDGVANAVEAFHRI